MYDVWQTRCTNKVVQSAPVQIVSKSKGEMLAAGWRLFVKLSFSMITHCPVLLCAKKLNKIYLIVSHTINWTGLALHKVQGKGNGSFVQEDVER